MFRVKICGITNVEDALVAAEAGADAIGLNFYPKSVRCVSVAQAGEITSVIHPESHTPNRYVFCVGVFVNSDFQTIQSADMSVYLSSIQFHGDESPKFLTHFAKPNPSGWKVIRARRFGAGGASDIARDLEACRQAGRIPDAILVDAMTHGSYGGTGQTVSWVGVADHKQWLGEVPLILAGGLTPDNVAEAIRIVQPAAVDVASGVESAPGKKDPAKVRDFVANALGAFAALKKGPP